ncbi:DUF853 family protein [Dyadobacter flavalbus]|uniref:DUF853 family protein n=1 Tax=Dyadobacter flavalbus TaxID=2579942 RepID=A0A5M8QX67_9BACT|nr:AAA family ATPase [Dyadobacter flavalbus]KAA6439928.1 DUF853 family protein [Dyadobacter flavalbus]
MVTSEKIVAFIRSRDGLNVSKIEKDAKVPAKTIAKAMIADPIEIPSKHLEAIEAALAKYGYSDEQRKKNANIISVVNHKGGVGKTTTVINLAKALSLEGFKVLMVDMDGQGNLSQCFNIGEPKEQVIDSLLGRTPLPVLRIDENLFLTPSDIRLAEKEKDLVSAVGAETRLSRKLDALKGDYDYILIDCPPSLNILTTSSLIASASCIVPIQPEASAYHGVNNLITLISEIREHSNTNLSLKGFVFTMVDKRTKIHSNMMDYIKESFKGIHTFETVITQSTAIKESQVAKEDLFKYSPQSAPWNQYVSLAKELINL